MRRLKRRCERDGEVEFVSRRRGKPSNRRTIEVVVYADGRVKLVAGQEVLPYKVFDPAQDIPLPADDKTLNARVEAVLKTRHPKEKWRPRPRPPLAPLSLRASCRGLSIGQPLKAEHS